MSVIRNVASGIDAARGILPRVEAARRPMLQAVHGDAPHRAAGLRYPRQISGGQQQRVALPALRFQPELYCWMTFSALDAELKDAIGDELKRTLLSYGCPVIFVSHNAERSEPLLFADDPHQGRPARIPGELLAPAVEER